MSNLRKLRQRREFRQKKLAEILNTTTDKLSRVETKQLDTLSINTIREYVEAMGGKLRLLFEFHDKIIEYLPDDSED